MAIAASAYAQPALFTDLGDLSTANSTSTVNVTLTAANNIQWYKAILPAVTATGGYIDLWTNSPGTVTDSELGVYDNLGAMKANDDDDGPGAYSALSFGLTSPTRAGPSGANAFNGRDGVLSAGTYWIAVGSFNVTFGTTAWTVTSSYTGTGRTMVLGWAIQIPGTPTPLAINSTTITPASGAAGSSFNAFATVVPGTFPTSTGITASLNASPVGAGTVALHDDGVAPDVTANDNIFSATVVTSGAATGGNKTLTFTANDAQARSATATNTFRVLGRPGSPIDLGDLSSSSASGNRAVTLTSATDIQWFLAKLPAVSATNGFVDLWTANPGDITDSEMGLYDDNGAMIANDDDDADGLLSALSFGQTTPTRAAIGTGVAFDGRDGVLAGGNYYIAVGRFNVTFNATNWDVSSSSTSTERTTTLNWNIQVPGTPTNPAGVAVHTPTSGLAGSTFVSTVTVTPGSFPNSTGITVSANASSVGAGTVALHDDSVAPDVTAGDNIFSANIATSGATTTGAKTITYTVSDAQSRSSTNNATYTIVPPPPANDLCANATPAIVGGNAFDNSSATTDGSASCGFTGSKDVWFSFTPPSNGSYVFNTCGVAFDSTLAIFDGCGGTELGCNDDDFTNCGSSASYVQVNGLLASQTYIVRVAGYGTSGANSGAGTLTISNVTPPPPTDPTGAGSVTPANPVAGTTVLLKVAVTPGANPTTTNHTVAVNLSGLTGGSATQTFYDDGTNGDVTAGDNVFSYSFAIDAGQADGTYPLAFTIGDAQGRPGSGSFNVNVVGAAQWDEITNGLADAGQTIATAQMPFGTGSLASIDGHFAASGDDVDIYRINICDFANFSATTVHPITNGGDTQLFLFDDFGTAIQMDDDGTTTGDGLSSRMANQFVTANGGYYLAVSHYNIDPLNAGGFPIWENTPFAAVRAPDGLTNGGDIVLDSWSATQVATFTNYRLVLTGTCFPCVSDFNRDGVIDFFDYLDFVDAFSTNAANADINLDGSIDFFDYLDFVDHFSTGC